MNNHSHNKMTQYTVLGYGLLVLLGTFFTSFTYSGECDFAWSGPCSLSGYLVSNLFSWVFASLYGLPLVVAIGLASDYIHTQMNIRLRTILLISVAAATVTTIIMGHVILK
jgi:hypothetical protein